MWQDFAFAAATPRPMNFSTVRAGMEQVVSGCATILPAIWCGGDNESLICAYPPWPIPRTTASPAQVLPRALHRLDPPRVRAQFAYVRPAASSRSRRDLGALPRAVLGGAGATIIARAPFTTPAYFIARLVTTVVFNDPILPVHLTGAGVRPRQEKALSWRRSAQCTARGKHALAEHR